MYQPKYVKAILWSLVAVSNISMAHGGATASVTEKKSNGLKIVALGTSLTALATWPEELEKNLSACGGRASVVKVAMSGETTGWALTELDRIVALQPDTILIELYANDAAFNRFISPRRSRDNFRKILEHIKTNLPATRVVLMGMNPFHGPRWLIRPFSDYYLELHRKEAEEWGVMFLDHRPAWNRVGNKSLREYIPDGSHPLPSRATEIMMPALLSLFPGCSAPR